MSGREPWRGSSQGGPARCAPPTPGMLRQCWGLAGWRQAASCSPSMPSSQEALTFSLLPVAGTFNPTRPWEPALMSLPSLVHHPRSPPTPGGHTACPAATPGHCDLPLVQHAWPCPPAAAAAAGPPARGRPLGWQATGYVRMPACGSPWTSEGVSAQLGASLAGHSQETPHCLLSICCPLPLTAFAFPVTTGDHLPPYRKGEPTSGGQAQDLPSPACGALCPGGGGWPLDQAVQ